MHRKKYHISKTTAVAKNDGIEEERFPNSVTFISPPFPQIDWLCRRVGRSEEGIGLLLIVQQAAEYNHVA